MTRLERIESALRLAFPDAQLVLTDESHRHAGHEGARDGRGHYALQISSAQFSGRLPIAQHRLVYAALGELMQTDIHALSIQSQADPSTPPN